MPGAPQQTLYIGSLPLIDKSIVSKAKPPAHSILATNFLLASAKLAEEDATPLPLSSRMRGPIPIPAKSLPPGSRGRQSIFRPSSLPILPRPLPLSSRMRGPIPVPCTEPAPVKTGTTIHLSSQLPSDPPAPPPVVLADAGTHPHPREEPTPMKTRAGNHHHTLNIPVQMPNPTLFTRPFPPCPKGSEHRPISS